MRDLTQAEVEEVNGGACTTKVSCTADSSGEVSCTVSVTCSW